MDPTRDLDAHDREQNAHQPAVGWRDVACAWALVLVMALFGLAL